MAVAFHEECPKIFDQVFLLAKTSQGLLPVKTALTRQALLLGPFYR